MTLADIASIKNGNDYILPNGQVVLNKDLTFYASEPRSYAYCSDTMFSEKLIGLLKGVDLLYHEATFANGELKLAKRTGHSTAEHAAIIASKAEVKELIIGHFSSRYKSITMLVDEAKSIFPNTLGVEDGMIFEIPVKKIVH